MTSLLDVWAQIAQLLRRAEQGLPARYDELGLRDLAAFEDYLAHHELALAWDVLAEVAEEREAGAACWTALAHAAHLMQLHGRATKARARAARGGAT